MHGETTNSMETTERALDLKMVQALEARPEVAVPVGFAARVAGQLPARNHVRGLVARRAVTLHPTHYGQWAMVASLAVLALTLAGLLASRFGGTTAGLVVEWVFYTQLLALIVWFGLRRVNIFTALWPHRSGR